MKSIRAHEAKVRSETKSDLRTAVKLDIDRALKVGVVYLSTPENERPAEHTGFGGCFAVLLCMVMGFIGARIGLLTGAGIGGFLGMVIGVFVVVAAYENLTESRYLPIEEFCREH